MAELLLLSFFFGVRGHEYLKHWWSTAFTTDSCLCPPGPADEADICQGGSRLLFQALSYSGWRGSRLLSLCDLNSCVSDQ